MRKHLCLVLTIITVISFHHNGFSQSLGVNTSGAPADNSAILDVSSNNKGMLLPRMSKTDRNAIVSPAPGLMVYQNAPDSIGFYYYDGTKWNWFAALNANADTIAWNRKGNANTNPSLNFIGTTDDQPLQFKVKNIKAALIDHQKANVLFGARAGFNLASSSMYNTIIGDSAFYANNQTLTSNVVIGYGAESQSNTFALQNTVIGWTAGQNNTSSWATIIGTQAGQNNTSNGSVFVGSAAGKKNTSGSSNTFVGDNSGRENTTGFSNSIFGSYAGQYSNGNSNNFFGFGAGSANTTGSDNTFIGSGAAFANTTGSNNIAIGTLTLGNLGSGKKNVAIGCSSLASVDNDSLNVAIGDSAGLLISSSRNITIGARAARSLSIGGSNTIIGDNAGYSITSASETILIGNDAGRHNAAIPYRAVVIGALAGDTSVASWSTVIGNLAGTKNTRQGNTMIGSSAGQNNTSGLITALGDNAGKSNSTGDLTALGYYAGTSNTIGSLTAVGNDAGYNNVNGSANVAIGAGAGFANISGSYNTMVGESAGFSNTGSFNSFIGRGAGYSHRLGSNNCYFGYHTGWKDSSGNNNTIIGTEAGFSGKVASNNSFYGYHAGYSDSSGSNNTFMGTLAGYNNTTASANAYFGASAGFSLKSGIYNTAVGYGAMSISDTSSNNAAFGAFALSNVKQGDRNAASGYGAGSMLKSGTDNVALGYNASVGDTANYSIAVGSNAGGKGDENVFMGHYAGYNTGTSSMDNNVCIGSNAGYNRQSTNAVLLGYNSNFLTTGLDNAIAIGANSRVDVSNAMVLGNSGVNVGIGVTSPTHAKLTLYSDALNGTPLGIFGYGQNGISIQQNWPTIGYNQYRDLAAANAAKYMGNGYAWVNTMEPTTGNIYWNSMPSGTANATGGAETNRMTLTNSGFLGVNTASPHAAIQTDNQINNRRIVLWEQNNNTTEFFGFGINSGVLRYQVPNANAGNAHQFFAANTLLLTIYGTGNATLAGTLTQLSDARLKKDITPIGNVLGGLRKLTAYNYYWIDKEKDNDQQIGLLAQEVEKVFPQLVKRNNDGFLSVNYSGFTPLLIKGMQEQQQTIDDLKKEVEELKQMIIGMKTQNN